MAWVVQLVVLLYHASFLWLEWREGLKAEFAVFLFVILCSQTAIHAFVQLLWYPKSLDKHPFKDVHRKGLWSRVTWILGSSLHQLAIKQFVRTQRYLAPWLEHRRNQQEAMQQ